MKTAEEILNEFSTDTTTKGRVRFEDAVKAIESVSEEKDRRIRELEEAQKWINVKDQTPPDYQRVLFIDNRDNMINLGYFVWKQTPCDYVTLWKPLPKPPKP